MIRNTRVFDVIVARENPAEMIPLKLVVVANSFSEAANCAVLEANNLLSQGSETGVSGLNKEPFTLADVDSMTVIRNRVAIGI